MKYIFIAATCILLLSSSCRLDNFLYNPNALDSYKFDDYEGELRFTLDDSYAIDTALIHLMTLESGPEEDRETIYAAYIGNIDSIAVDTVILYCHGNAAHMDAYWPRVKLLANTGGKNRFGVLFMDYRGFGMSTGKPTEAGMYYDVDACMQWLKDKGLTNDRLIINGFSLGCAPSCELTANPRSMQASKIILEAPFASFDYIVQDVAKLSLPGSLYANLEVDNAEEIKKINIPFLWVHGIEDDFIGIEHGALIAQNYQGFHKVERRIVGGGHSTIPPVMGYDQFMQLMLDFITGAI